MFSRIFLTVALLAFSQFSARAADLSGYDVYFINGMLAQPAGIRNSVQALSSELSGITVTNLYNTSYGLKDVVDVYIEKTGEIPEPTLDVSRLVKYIYQTNFESMDLVEAVAQVMVLRNDVGLWSEQDLQSMIARVKASLTAGRKVLIVPHSQGNFFYRNIWQELQAWDSQLANQCMAGVGFGSPLSSAQYGNYNWITNTRDDIINAVRVFWSNTLPGNITVPNNFNGDKSGHEFLRTYMAHPISLSEFSNDLDAVTQQVNAACAGANCATPLGDHGGVGGDNYIYNLTNTTPHLVEIHFEAFTIPDEIEIRANGVVIASTPGLVSGYHKWVIDYDPAIHGTAFTVDVVAPDPDTQWEICIDCEGSACQSTGVPVVRKSVDYAFHVDDTIWVCPTEYEIDGATVSSFGDITLTEGSHVFSLDPTNAGLCFCDSINTLACEAKAPYVYVDGQIYSLYPNPFTSVIIGNPSYPVE